MIKIFIFLISLSIISQFKISPVSANNGSVINEFLAHPSTGSKEWIEFYNPDGIELSTYWLDDDTDFNSDSGSSAKKSLSAINKSDPTHPYLEFDSFLNNGGDYVVLFDPGGVLVDQYQYTNDPGADVSIGRSPDGNNKFVILAQTSKGSSNGQALPSPTPSPQQSSTPTPQPTKSPSPSPTPITTAKKSPTPTPKSSPEVLAEKAEISPTPSAEPTQPPSPSPSPQASTSNVKIAGLLSGSGLILIGISFGLYLWYSKRLSKNPNKANDDKPEQKIF